MNRPVFKRVSPTCLREDGYHYLTGNWMGGRPMPLFAGQNLGVIVETTDKRAALSVSLQAFHANGQPLTNGTSAIIQPGTSLTYDFAVPPSYLERLGRITILVTPDTDPGHPEELVAETYPGLWGMFGSDVLNPLPMLETIATLEAQTGHPLCEDHRRFLDTRNGINFAWWQEPVWLSSGSGGEDFYTHLDQRIQEKAPDIGLLIDATYLFGVGNAHPYLSYPDKLGNFDFYSATFLRFGIPVGVDAGGNLYVQILDGGRRGEVVFLDHEYHFGLLDQSNPPQLAPDIRVSAPDKPLQDLTADEFWATMDTIGYSLPVAPSLDAMIERLTAHHNALIAALAPYWRKP